MELRLAVGGFQPADVVKKGQLMETKPLKRRGTKSTEERIQIIDSASSVFQIRTLPNCG
jgi:hypothetical protein